MRKIRKVMALLLTLAMVMGMSLTVFAEPVGASATITINHAGEKAKFNKVQIVQADPTTTTGWNIIDEYMDEFTSANAFVGMDEQRILEGMIFEATDGKSGTEIQEFDTKYAAALDAICATIEAPSATTGETSPLTVNAAGVYVIRGFEEDFTYGTMAAYIAFGPYDVNSGVPTGLVDTEVEAKRVPTHTEKVSDDSDKVVEIGRTVTYTVTSTVPYIAPTELASAQYWFQDTLQGADYVLSNDTVSVQVSTTNGFSETFTAVPTNDGEEQSIKINLSKILQNNAYANDQITITYQAIVTDTYTENDASMGNGENDDSFGTDTEKLFTGEVTMTKYAEDGETTLESAGFKVRKVGSDVDLTFIKTGDGTYEYSPNGTITEVFTGEKGTVTLSGLDLGGYEFKETTAPEGYSINSETRVAVIELIKDKEMATSANDILDGETTITDTKLAELPGTGGIGTTIFTIGGCVIMIAAAGLYFASRRKHGEN